MKSFEQRQAANVADVDRAAGRDNTGCLLQHGVEVIKRREVLDHRVENYRVERVGFEAGKIVGSLPAQCHVWPVALIEMLLYEVERHLREVNATVMLTLTRQTEQQQAGATTQLQHTSRLQFPDLSDSLSHPLLHFLRRNRLARITAVPTGDVEARVRNVFALSISLVEDFFPTADELATAF